MLRNRCSIFLCACLLLAGCRDSKKNPPLVIWVTGGLKAEWYPHAASGEPASGGLLRIARALDIYREPNDLLVDLGRFRYPEGISGETREWRLRANGFLKTLARMNYTAMNVSLYDLGPWPPELADLAEEYNLPLVSCNLGSDTLLFPSSIDLDRQDGTIVQIIGLSGGSNEFQTLLRPPEVNDRHPDGERHFRIVLTDASRQAISEFCQEIEGINLVIRLTEGVAAVAETNGIPMLEMGSEGNCLARIELRYVAGGAVSVSKADFPGWLDGKPYQHHPVRERILSTWRFWRKRPVLSAFLWAVPPSLSPQKLAQTQMNQANEDQRHLVAMEDLHRETASAYAGPQSCIACHQSDHSDSLPRLHQSQNMASISSHPLYERCLPCHATGFDDPGGFLLPWERPDLQGVTCEACHGAAYHHALNGDPPYPCLPSEKSCKTCHSLENLPIGHPRDL